MTLVIAKRNADVRGILEDLGIDVLTDENFRDTPERWLAFLRSYTVPYDAEVDLSKTFKAKGRAMYDHAMVVQVGIPYRAVCAHHLLPVLGAAHVGYVPDQKVVGLSKLTRLVYGITHSTPSLQEDVCSQITNELMRHLKPFGAMCVISAEHGCMASRGVEEATGQIQTMTASIKGLFIEKYEARDEFYRLVNLNHA